MIYFFQQKEIEGNKEHKMDENIVKMTSIVIMFGL